MRSELMSVACTSASSAGGFHQLERLDEAGHPLLGLHEPLVGRELIVFDRGEHRREAVEAAHHRPHVALVGQQAARESPGSGRARPDRPARGASVAIELAHERRGHLRPAAAEFLVARAQCGDRVGQGGDVAPSSARRQRARAESAASSAYAAPASLLERHFTREPRCRVRPRRVRHRPRAAAA